MRKKGCVFVSELEKIAFIERLKSKVPKNPWKEPYEPFFKGYKPTFFYNAKQK